MRQKSRCAQSWCRHRLGMMSERRSSIVLLITRWIPRRSSKSRFPRCSSQSLAANWLRRHRRANLSKTRRANLSINNRTLRDGSLRMSVNVKEVMGQFLGKFLRCVDFIHTNVTLALGQIDAIIRAHDHLLPRSKIHKDETPQNQSRRLSEWWEEVKVDGVSWMREHESCDGERGSSNRSPTVARRGASPATRSGVASLVPWVYVLALLCCCDPDP